MPTVPTVESFNATPSPLPGARQEFIVSPDLLGASADQQTRLGNAALGAGNALNRIALQMQEQVDQVREDDALNKLRRRMLDLTYDKEQGYAERRGDIALQPDEAGRALPESYAAKLQQSAEEITTQLGNENQRRRFALRAGGIVTQFQGNVQAHMLKEYERHALSTQEGTVRIGRETALANWRDGSDTGLRQEGIDSVKSAVAKAGQLTGESASETVAKMLDAESGIHRGVIEAALRERDTAYALDYFRTHGKEGKMAAKDILAVQDALRLRNDAGIAIGAVGDALKKNAPLFAPTELDRLVGVVQAIESGGRDANPDGTPLTSPKGARYAMQVMPGTAKNPGFGIQPAGDDSAEEYNRVGRQYLAAMVQRYGNTAQALAAYNAGPDALDTALVKAKNDDRPEGWLTYLPKETQGYVQAGLAKSDAGVGAPKPPTEIEFVTHALEALPATRTPEQIKATRDQAEHQYKLLVEDRKQRKERAESDAQQALIANGGDFNALDPVTKSNLARLDPEAYTRVQGFAKKLTGAAETNLAAYSAAVANPEELARMSEPMFLDFVKRNFTDTDGKHIASLRAGVLNGKVTDTVDSINSPAINALLKERLPDLGIDPSPKKGDTANAARIGGIQKFIRDDIFTQQRHLGRKMTPREITEHVDNLFTKSVTFRNTLFGAETGGTTETRLLSLTPSDLPAETLKRIDASFAARGITKPTDSDRMQVYWKWKNGR